MPTVAVHPDAFADIEAIKANNLAAGARILALLEQLAADPDLLDRLTQHDFGAAGNVDFHVSRWESQQNKYKRNLWRLKVWDLERQNIHYRLIYAFDPKTHRILVLGVTARKAFNYEDSDPFTKRIVDCYERKLGGH